MEGRFLSFAKGAVGQEDYLASGFFASATHFFFARRDKWRYQHTSIFCKIFPVCLFLGKNGRRIGAVNHHRGFEGIVEQLEIAVSLPKAITDSDIVDFSEEIGVLPSCLQPSGILLNILNNRREAMVTAEIAVMEIRGEDIRYFRKSLPYQLTASHLHHAYVSSDSVWQIFLSKNREMDVGGHDDILENPKRGTEIWEIGDLRLDDSSDG